MLEACVGPDASPAPSRSGGDGSNAPKAATGGGTGKGEAAVQRSHGAAPLLEPKPTAMDGELRELGLDPKALPTLSKLSPEQLRGVMKTFTKALGVQCKACHDTASFRAPTKNKKTATHMWNDFVRGLRTSDGRPIYCDSCHAGRKDVLDRSDLDALSTWMKGSFIEPLKRADGKDHDCSTCHGDPMEPKILSRLWK